MACEPEPEFIDPEAEDRARITRAETMYRYPVRPVYLYL